ncbi:MAG TPA: MFS transporter [Thermoplasmata archaeon]|nr:MFS transporter [Thermoplasmata archaeon]
MGSGSETSSSRAPRRRDYRALIAVLAIQTFANQMAGSFWLVYLVSPPQSLPFAVAVLVWVIGFGIAACTVLVVARGQPNRATPTMTMGLSIMALGHVAFATLPPLWGMVIGGLCFGLYIPLFWLPLNSLIVSETNVANRAGRLAGITATFAITGVLGPILGGLIAASAGYRLVFALSAAIVAANLVAVRRLAQVDEVHSYSVDFRRIGRRTALAFTGQGGVDGLASAATPLGSFLFTSASLELGLLFALFSLAAGVAAVVLGRVSDRVRARTPFLLLGPVLSVPACLLAFLVRDLGTFAFAIGWFSMTSAVAPSFIYTILVDRSEADVPAVTATRELVLNVSRTVALLGGLVVLASGGDVYSLYLLIGGVILLEALAR